MFQSKIVHKNLVCDSVCIYRLPICHQLTVSVNSSTTNVRTDQTSVIFLQTCFPENGERYERNFAILAVANASYWTLIV